MDTVDHYSRSSTQLCVYIRVPGRSQTTGSMLRISDLVGEVGPKMCLANRFPSDADQGPQFEKH